MNDERKKTTENGEDPLYGKAVQVVRRTRKPSISVIQKALLIGYLRAERLLAAMERNGVVTRKEADGSRNLMAPVVLFHAGIDAVESARKAGKPPESWSMDHLTAEEIDALNREICEACDFYLENKERMTRKMWHELHRRLVRLHRYRIISGGKKEGCS